MLDSAPGKGQPWLYYRLRDERLEGGPAERDLEVVVNSKAKMSPGSQKGRLAGRGKGSEGSVPLCAA